MAISAGPESLTPSELIAQIGTPRNAAESRIIELMCAQAETYDHAMRREEATPEGSTSNRLAMVDRWQAYYQVAAYANAIAIYRGDHPPDTLGV
jgi:hypothetical protein